MRLRAAVLGCGWIGAEFRTDGPLGIYNHAAAYSACAHTDLVALCDTDPLKLNRAAERWEVKQCYTDAGELFANAQPEVVSICTPDATHFACIKAALSASSVRAILAEKPLALKQTEALELADLETRRGVKLAVNYSLRY
jgi:predicted dehydrogenase